jgi:hypothetical protein
LRAQLQSTTRLREQLAAGGALDLETLRFTEVTVSLHGNLADVLAHADASGRFAGASIHYTGSERLAVRREAEGFSGIELPALKGVLEALAKRQRAIEGGDDAALMALAADDYRDGSVDRARLASSLSTLWPGVERAAPSSLAVRVDGDRASVSLRFDRDGASHTHTVALHSEAKCWLFSAGLL